MDYLKSPPWFKVKKVARYVRLYGPARTYVKVLGQLHMKRKLDPLPENDRPASARQSVGLLGCGNYAFANIAYYLCKHRGAVLRGVMDRNLHRAASLGKRYGAAYYTDDAERVLADPAIRLVYIASNHASHAEYAIRGLDAGKSVYIEKPHVVSHDQLARLAAAMQRSEGRVFLGFNRPESRLGRLLRGYLAAESGPGMYAWFVAGHAIDPDHWYFKPEEGGRVLGNLCHWTDFTLGLVKDAFPIEINPTRAAASDSNISVSYRFADDTIAVITFSSKGHTFEGVREKFVGHRGNCLLQLDDFQTLRTEVLDRKRVFRSLYRDQGHAGNIVRGYDGAHGASSHRESVEYVWNTGLLFLETRRALESDQRLTVAAYAGSPALPAQASRD